MGSRRHDVEFCKEPDWRLYDAMELAVWQKRVALRG